MMKLVRSSSCPSKITLATSTMRRCGNCGGMGHNRRTCGVPEVYAAICHPTSAPKPSPKPVDRKIQKQCGHCGILGHNRRTCPILKGVPTVIEPKTYTTTQLFARLPNYIIPEKRERAPMLEGLKGCKRLFRESKTTPFPPAAERRAVQELLNLL